MKKLICMAAAAVIMSATVSHAGIGQGAKELGLNVTGGYTTTDGGDQGDLGAQVSFGYFVTDKIQVGVSFMDVLSSNETVDTTTGEETWDTNNMLNIAAQAKFYLPGDVSNPVHAYVGPHMGVTTIYNNASDSTMTGYAYGLLGGLDIFVTENAALNGEFRYTHSSLSDDNGGVDFEQDDYRGLVGFKVFFGGK